MTGYRDLIDPERTADALLAILDAEPEAMLFHVAPQTQRLTGGTHNTSVTTMNRRMPRDRMVQALAMGGVLSIAWPPAASVVEPGARFWYMGTPWTVVGPGVEGAWRCRSGIAGSDFVRSFGEGLIAARLQGEVAAPAAPATPEAPERPHDDGLRVDIEATIHQACRSDSSDDAHVDWVRDLTESILALVDRAASAHEGLVDERLVRDRRIRAAARLIREGDRDG